MTMPFQVNQHVEADGVAWLRVRGEIDHDVTGQLTEVVAAAARQDGVVELVIDLGEVRFLDAAGLRCLLEGRSAALGRGSGYRVVNAQGVVERVLRITGLLELLGSGPVLKQVARRS